MCALQADYIGVFIIFIESSYEFAKEEMHIALNTVYIYTTHILYSEILAPDEEGVKYNRHTTQQLEQVEYSQVRQLTWI